METKEEKKHRIDQRKAEKAAEAENKHTALQDKINREKANLDSQKDQ